LLSEPVTPNLLDRPTLAQLGWSEYFATSLAAMPDIPTSDHEDAPPVQLVVGRVIAVHRGRWTVAGPEGLIGADLLGIFRLGNPIAVPAVGDWVRVHVRSQEDSKASAALAVATASGYKTALLSGTIQDVLPRTSVLVRKTTGDSSDGQVIASNADVVLIVIPLDAPMSARRIERQLTTVFESGARPVFVATKADLATPGIFEELVDAAGDVPVIRASTQTGEGFAEIESIATAGVSLVLLGTSGAGKSSIVNRLLGSEVMATKAMGVANKGRHTTTHRELLALPTGALLIDTPGMRELGLWMSGNEDGVAATFAEVDEVAESCRFSDCRHSGDSGCAISAAIADGTLDPLRVEAWKRLSNEQQLNADRNKARLSSERASPKNRASLQARERSQADKGRRR
jgi:ribosome biogenesis GTPase / thiamine phosphate phosphatase